MRAGVGGNPRQAPLALALTLLVHAVLLLAWLQGRPVRKEAAGALREFSVLLPVPAARPQPRASLPSRRPARPPAAAAPANPVAAPAQPQPSAPAAPAAPSSPAAPSLPAAPSGEEIAARAKRDAGRAFRELNGGGKSIVPDNPDTPWARFRNGLENAHVESGHMETMDTYTSPDGVVIYRFRQGNRVRCRMTGGVGLGIPGGYTPGQQLAGAGSLSGGGSAGFVACPTGKPDWVRH